MKDSDALQTVHPQIRGKIEHYNHFIKNVVKLYHYYLPGEPEEEEINKFVEYNNNERYHESLNNVPPAVVFLGWAKKRLIGREEIEQKRLRGIVKSTKNYYKKGHLKKAFTGGTVS